MPARETSIKRKVMMAIMLTVIAVLLVMIAAFMIYDLVTFRQTMVRNLATQGQIVAENSTAALAFKNESDARNVLYSLDADPHIKAAVLYDVDGKLFVKYPAQISASNLPRTPQKEGTYFEKSQLTLFQPVIQDGRRLGTLYLRSDLNAISTRLELYGLISLLIMLGSLLVALWLSNTMQRRIADPIIALAGTAQKISEQHDYSMRAEKLSNDEIGLLTDSFNNMLSRIQASDSALRASEAQFRLVTDQAPVLLAHMNRDYRYKFVNQPYAARYGREPHEVVGRHAVEIVGLELFEKARPHIERALGGEPVQFELEIPDAMRGSRWTHAEYTPERTPSGEVIGFVAVHTDITARKRHEAEVSKLMQQRDEQARLFDATLSSITDLAYTFDLEGNWIYANKPLLQIWGKSLKEITGKSSLELGYPPELAERLKRQVKEVIQTGKPLKGETLFTDAAGIEDYHEYIFSPVLSPNGQVTAVCGTTRLTTERKRAEMELERARDQALAASRAKDDFLAALSHELRTPLNPVLLVASEAAGNLELPVEVRNMFETISKNVALEARLIDDLLDLTRITRNKLPLDLQITDVHAVLQNAVETVQADIERKQIIFTTSLKATSSKVLGDAVRLQQIFWNVLKNAVKFTAENGRISLETLVEKEQLIVKISDTGIGMTALELKSVFDAFVQGDHSIGSGSHRFGGLGLGLAISQKLAQLHSGIIRADSEGRNKGATFVITLPLLLPAESRENFQNPQPVLSKFPPASSGGIRILLVEDHEPTRTALAHLLKRRYYEIRTAGSLAEAREIAGKEKFDLLISDIGLPDGNGNDLMVEFHERYGLKGIALTGYGMEEDVIRSRTAGFVAHLTKPVHVRALEAALATVHIS